VTVARLGAQGAVEVLAFLRAVRGVERMLAEAPLSARGEAQAVNKLSL
jgi:hypothetical protein